MSWAGSQPKVPKQIDPSDLEDLTEEQKELLLTTDFTEADY